MRIARIELEGAPVTALVEGDAVRPLPGVGVTEALTGATGERGEAIPLEDARLLAPIEPASVRDFSVFEQHGEGAVMFFAGLDAKVQEAWYEGPAFYFSNPHATTGPGEVIEPPAGAQRPRPRARGRRDHRPPRAQHRGGGGGRPTSPATRSSTTGPSATSRRGRRGCRSASTRPRTSPTRSGPGSSRPTSSSPTATATGSTCA